MAVLLDDQVRMTITATFDADSSCSIDLAYTTEIGDEAEA